MKRSFPRVLVLGVVPSLTWLVARCLSRAGHAPVILAWHAAAPIMASADCSAYIAWSPLRKQGGQLDPSALDQVRAVCRSHRIDTVLGADLDSALLLSTCGVSAELPCSAVPATATINTFNNKWSLTQMLPHIGLPAPDSEYIANAQQLLATQLEFPIITKPLDKWASVGFQLHRDRASLQQVIERNALSSDYPLIAQRFIPGWDVGASFLAREGRLAAYSLFEHHSRGERIFFSEPRLRKFLDDFVEATGYNGVGHLDLRYDPSRDAYAILELNPRFWASLLYSTNAGLNYPECLVRLPQWDGCNVRTTRAMRVKLGLYERAMTLGHRWFGMGYEKLTRATL